MRHVLLVTLLLVLAPAALAWHPRPSACPMHGVVEVTDGTPERTFYLDLGEGDLADVSVYFETNGLWHASPPGVYRGAETDGDLQRGPSAYLPDDAETCVDDPLVIPDGFLLL